MEVDSKTPDKMEGNEMPDTTQVLAPEDVNHAATIVFNIPSVDGLVQKLHDENLDVAPSDPIFYRGMKWSIRVGFYGHEASRFLSVYVKCQSENESKDWNCHASMKLSLCSQREGNPDYANITEHCFNENLSLWGFAEFMSVAGLLEENNGYSKNGSFTVKAEILADAPITYTWDDLGQAKFIGLKNQGATCYLNALLQTLFFTNKLRKAVYMMPTENDDPYKSVALGMQRIFYELQFSDTSVDTGSLTTSFGWDTIESFYQHDVQEFSRILLDKLEEKMKGTPVDGTIKDLFCGTLRSYIKCVDVQFESSRDENFYDLQLNVKGKPSIIESFRDYTAVETLDGDNLYDTGEEHGKQKAVKGIKFVKFPPVLHLQLMRFHYDPEFDATVKINDRYEFPEMLDLNEFVDTPTDDFTYVLQSVLVHIGGTGIGHYVVYVNTSQSLDEPKWCKFDDDFVSAVLVQEAIQGNYGSSETMSSSNAYILVYVQKNKISEVMCPVDEDFSHLKERFPKQEYSKFGLSHGQMNYNRNFDVRIITDAAFANYSGFDLGEYKELTEGKVGISLQFTTAPSVDDFYKTVGEKLNLSIGEFRLWKFESFGGNLYEKRLEIYRPHLYVKDQQAYDLFDYWKLSIFYVETGLLAEYDHGSFALTFVKAYNPISRKFKYVGSLVLSVGKKLSDYTCKIIKMAEFRENTDLNFYLEVSPDCIVSLKDQMDEMIGDKIINGMILVVEDSSQVNEENNTKTAFKRMYEYAEVSIKPKVDQIATSIDPASESFKLSLYLFLTAKKLRDMIGKLLNHDAQKIILWKPDYYGQSSHLEEDKLDDFVVHDLLSSEYYFLHDPRIHNEYTIYYSKLPFSLDEFNDYTPLHVQLMDYKFGLKDVDLFPPNMGTLKDVLTEARQYLNFSPNGTGVLRMLLIRNDSEQPPYSIISDDANLKDLKELHGQFTTLRIEEIPVDQMNVGENERLILTKYYRSGVEFYDVFPFLIKIVDGESLSQIKQRVKSILRVPDEVFEKLKLSFIVDDKEALKFEEQDENVTVNLGELEQGDSKRTIFLAIMGSSNQSSGRSVQKSLVIHN